MAFQAYGILRFPVLGMCMLYNNNQLRISLHQQVASSLALSSADWKASSDIPGMGPPTQKGNCQARRSMTDIAGQLGAFRAVTFRQCLYHWDIGDGQDFKDLFKEVLITSILYWLGLLVSELIANKELCEVCWCRSYLLPDLSKNFLREIGLDYSRLTA